MLFEVQPGWHAQIECLKRKHQELISKLRYVNISIEQAVYAINAKIVPAMAYALQVATVPDSLIRKWDKAHCNIVRRVGKLSAASAIQDHFFHLPKAEGGLGLSSLLLERNKSLIAMDFHANNETNFKLGQSLQSKVVRAGRVHKNRPSSIHHTIHNAMVHLGCAFHETPPEFRIQAAMDLDLSKAACVLLLENVHAYTDGGTTMEGEIKSSWGVCIQTENEQVSDTHPTNKGTITLSGRLVGDQKNDIAEAYAFLRALREVNPSTPGSFYIDNLGVIQTAGQALDPGVRQRATHSARSTWRRIRALLLARQQLNTRTDIKWIHSHVDDANRRQWKPSANHTCACGGIRLDDGSLACDPTHPHHIGNQLADELATLAQEDADIDINLARPFESPVMGE